MTLPYTEPLPAYPYGFEFATQLSLTELLKSFYQVLVSSNPSGDRQEKVLSITGCEALCGKKN